MASAGGNGAISPALATSDAAVDIVRTALPPLPGDLTSAERFQAAVTALKAAAKQAEARPKPEVRVMRDAAGARLATLTSDSRAVALKLARKDNPEFGQWIEEHAEAALRDLYDQWQKESGAGS